MTKIYRVPFADGGTKNAIPIPADPNAKVSDTEGFTGRYELPNTDPNYLPIERGEFNGILNDVTTALGEVQQFGFAKWQAGTWPQGARCVEGGIIYRALTTTSNQPPHADWVEDAPNIAPLLQPSMTGSITTNGSTDNTLALTAIVSTLGLEVGDVVSVNYSGYNKLHTVESITNNGNIIVNYEHAGNRGNGSLKLANTTVSATITRIAKWYNAPVGLGQGWVQLLPARSPNTAYINTTARTLCLSAVGKCLTSDQYAQLSLVVGGDTTVGFSATPTPTGSWSPSTGVHSLIPPNVTYSVNVDAYTTLTHYAELR